ncbi:hypothetical protein OK411_13420 [Pseudomonas sp. RG1]|uniref:hypothetical protein n=1 Tax=Pseudomonas TaxID=286 RepID=UPI00221EEA1F|nr:hypothetical protein [Pseudomonas sp. RG1]MCW0921382.1 hypothetical protein [Pseudomonas sp. RG1]
MSLRAGLKYSGVAIDNWDQVAIVRRLEALTHRGDIEFFADVLTQEATADFVTSAVEAHKVVPIAVDALAVRFPPADPTHTSHNSSPDAQIDSGKTARVH